MVAQSPILWNVGDDAVGAPISQPLQASGFACTFPSFLNGLPPVNRTVSRITKLSPPERSSENHTTINQYALGMFWASVLGRR